MRESHGLGNAERAEMNALLEATDQARHVMGHSFMTPDRINMIFNEPFFGGGLRCPRTNLEHEYHIDFRWLQERVTGVKRKRE